MKKWTTLTALSLLTIALQAQGVRETLVGLTLQHPTVKAYAASWDAYYLLQTPACNSDNCQADLIKADKPVALYSKEEFFMRALAKWIEIRDIQAKEDEATVTVFLVGSGLAGIQLKFVRKSDTWDWGAELPGRAE